MKLETGDYISDSGFLRWLDWIIFVEDKRLEAIEKHLGIKTWGLEKAINAHEIYRKLKENGDISAEEIEKYKKELLNDLLSQN